MVPNKFPGLFFYEDFGKSFGDIGEKFTCAAAMRRGVIPDLSPGFLSVTFATMNSMTSICPCLTAK